MKNKIATIGAVLSVALASCAAGEESFTKACKAAADQADGRSVAGADKEWLFLKSEIAHLGTGPFWEKDWATVSEAGADPVPMFLALNEKLQAIGVNFIFVPVPAKAAIYPEKMIANAKAGDAVALAPFLKRLKDGGITVIDLEPELLAARSGETTPSYCKTDAHPAPSTFQRIAARVAAELQDEPWVAAAAVASGLVFEVAEPSTIEIKGDLIPDDKIASWPAEKLWITKVSAGGEQVRPEDEASPVIVLGDSHAMYFSQGGEFRASGAGVVDHLQARLGFPVYLAAQMGSSSQAQRQIYKGPEFWKNKKVLVWISSTREFTQERKWLKLPKLPK